MSNNNIYGLVVLLFISLLLTTFSLFCIFYTDKVKYLHIRIMNYFYKRGMTFFYKNRIGMANQKWFTINLKITGAIILLVCLRLITVIINKLTI